MRRVVYVLTAAGQGFMRNPTMSLASTFTVALMLTLFAFFLTTDRGLQATVTVLEGKVELATFIDDNADGISQASENGIPFANVAVRLRDGSLENLLVTDFTGTAGFDSSATGMLA